MPDNRVYPSNTDEQANVAATLNSIAKSDLVRGTHYGLENPRGVGFPDSFDGYTYDSSSTPTVTSLNPTMSSSPKGKSLLIFVITSCECCTFNRFKI